MRKRIRLITSLCCGLLAVMLAAAYGEQARAEVRAERSEVLERYGGEVVSLLVAKQELSAGTIVSETNTEMREWLADLAPKGALTSLDEAVGLRLSCAVAANEPLNELDVASQEGAIDIPEGRVAISVSLSDKTGLVQSVSNGSRVLCYRNVDSSLKSICSDALVISTNGATTASSAYSTKNTICLAVLPEYVEEVLAASSDASLRLVLPAQGVEAPISSAPTDVENLGESDFEGEVYAEESATGEASDESGASTGDVSSEESALAETQTAQSTDAQAQTDQSEQE